jgi:Flp pilus assembly protein CpaB
MSRPAPTDRAGRARLPVQSRDRRPALAALALLLVIAGGLGAALVVYRTGQKTDVLVATHEIKPGSRITDGDLGVARVSHDAGSVIKAADRGALVGTYAITDIPGDTLLNPGMFQSRDVIPDGALVVGVSVDQDARPAGGVAAGDVVRVFAASKQNNNGNNDQPVELIAAARVVDVRTTDSGGATIVSLLVGQDDAEALVVANAAGTIALAELPLGTTPTPDFQKS